MANLDETVFGYYRGRVEPADNTRLINALLKLGICSEITPSGDFSLRKRDKQRFTSYAKGRLRFEIGEPRGLYGFILRSRYRYGAFLAILLSVIFYVFSAGMVWDIRVSGNENMSDYSIEQSLNEHGLKIGSRWSKLNKTRVENDLLKSNSDIAWISVNRRGTVAYVEVIESENVGHKEATEYPFSNIVADRDGVIEEITVERGVATVKPGDVVKKGDILISGVVENERGVSFCSAAGTVKATSVATVSAETGAEAVIKSPKNRRLTELRVIIFNFSINIFKNYRNCENGCDIIEENRKIALFGKYRLPIRFEKAYSVSYEEVRYTRSPDEMSEVAKRELDSKIYSMFKDADIVKLRTAGELKDGVYRLSSRVVYSTDIGKSSAIEIN